MLDKLIIWNKLYKKIVVIRDVIVPGANLIDPIPKQVTRNLNMMKFTQNNFVSKPVVSAAPASTPSAPNLDFASLTKEIDNNLETIKNAEKQEKKEQEQEKKYIKPENLLMS